MMMQRGMLLSQRSIFLIHCTQLLWLTRAGSSFYVPFSSTATAATTVSAATFATTTTATTMPSSITSSLLSSSSSVSTLIYASAPTLTFGDTLSSTDDESKNDNNNNYDGTLVIGKKASVEKSLPALLKSLGFNDDVISKPVVDSLISSLNEKTGGSASTLFITGEGGGSDEEKKTHKLTIAGLPSKVSRNNHPMGVHTLTNQAALALKGDVSTARVIILSDGFDIGPLAAAVAKAFPLFSRKTEKKSATAKEKSVHVIFCQEDGITPVNDPQQIRAAEVVASGVRLAARLVDSHPELLTTTQFYKEVETLVGNHPQVTIKQIIGEELKKYGGMHGVGKAANCPPRMVILEYTPECGTTAGDGDDDVETVALVGKGIVFDTGGLSLKTKTGMCGMKSDMGGAAGLFAGFWGAVQLQVPKKVYCILCLAENAIGPDAVRNDDILDMYSGKTVEVNNADAEGRLVLADGVAHATKHIENLNLVMNMCTLTGAQMVTTGKKHAGILANSVEIEQRAVMAGMHSGDLCYPMLYAPELLMDEFKSEVADMKNSVKDRSNAQASCAGHFIESHLDENYHGGWLHVDMAGPSTKGERGTGYGVSLVLSLLHAPGFRT